MATACTYCGQDLPRDDAHFCNNCGMLVPSHPFSSQSLAAANSATPPTRREPEKPVLREQMVQQPRPRTTRRIAPEHLSASPVAWPAPITHVSVKDSPTQKEDEHVAPQESQPVQNASLYPVPPERELHVKVWEQEQNNPPTPLPESTVETIEGNIEDAPTSSLATPEQLNIGDSSSETLEDNIEDAPTSSLATPEQLNIGDPSPQQGSDTQRDDVEHLDTVPMPNYAETQTPPHAPQQASHLSHAMHGNTPLPPLPVEPQQQRQQGFTITPIPYSSMAQQPAPLSQSPKYSSAQISQAPYAPPTQEKRIPVASASASGASRRQKSRVPFIILLALLGILVLGGGAWVLLAQPFSISPITQPLQDFKDTRLGVALSYPNSWSVQHTATGILFSDSSHTAQVKLMLADDTSDAARYVQQQATKSGMTAIKPLGTSSFGGSSWQRVQGNIQQDGANYTTTMLATVRGNHMYVLTQMAPQNVYTDEESVVFSAMRNSFTFL